MPDLRSGISCGRDDSSAWRDEVVEATKLLAKIHKGKENAPLRGAFSSVAKRMKSEAQSRRTASYQPDGYGTSNDEFLRWLERLELRAIDQHETRGHMASVLGRYLFAAVFGAVRCYSPKAADFPLALSPDDRNWHSGVFNDRFRVQLADAAATTVCTCLRIRTH